MTEFTKTKMHFTLALLGAMFALHPFLNQIQEWGFPYGFDEEHQVQLKVLYVYSLLAGLLALTVYFYSLILVSVRWAGLAERVGNYIYAFTMMLLPLYGGLYLAHLVEKGMLQQTEIGWMVRFAPWVAVGLGAVWLVVTQVGVFWLRGKLSDQDVAHRTTQLMEREALAVDRSQELFAAHHYDLAAIEAWKAVESRLQRALLAHDYHELPTAPELLITTAQRAGIIDAARRERINEVWGAWHTAIGSVPIAREAAEKSLQTTRELLSMIAVLDVRRFKRPGDATA